MAGAWRAWLQLAPPTADTDMIGYRRESLKILAEWHAVSADPRRIGASRHLGYYQNLILDTLRRYHVPLPPDHLLFWRVLLMLDAIAIQPPLSLDILPIMHRFLAPNASGLFAGAAAKFATPNAVLARLDLVAAGPADARLLLRNAAAGHYRWRGVRRGTSAPSVPVWPAEILPVVTGSLAILAAGAAIPPAISTVLYLAAGLCAGLAAVTAFKRRVARAKPVSNK